MYYRYSTNLLNRVRKHIAKGGIIAYPTEYCYGFGCSPFQQQSIAKILKLKRRSKGKGLIVIAAQRRQLQSLIQPLAAADEGLVGQYWPGPYSLILPVKAQVPQNLIGKHAKIAVRVTRHILVRQLCQALNSALISTSANRAGFKPVRSYRECMRQFGKTVMVVPGITNFAKRPSTIIDWATKEKLR